MSQKKWKRNIERKNMCVNFLTRIGFSYAKSVLKMSRIFQTINKSS